MSEVIIISSVIAPYITSEPITVKGKSLISGRATERVREVVRSTTLRKQQ